MKKSPPHDAQTKRGWEIPYFLELLALVSLLISNGFAHFLCVSLELEDLRSEIP